MKIIKFKVKGASALLMHNGQTADPLNEYAKKLKSVSGKKKKSDADHEAMARIEFDAGLYLNDEGQPYIPSLVLEAGICTAARASKQGKDAQSSIQVLESGALEYDGPTNADEMYEKGFFMRTGVRIGKIRVMRTRPMIPRGWTQAFSVGYDEDVLNADHVVSFVDVLGSKVGLCDWRPKFGRFEILSAK